MKRLYVPGDKVLDLTFDPPSPSVVVAKHEKKPGAYYDSPRRRPGDVWFEPRVIYTRNLKRMNRLT